MGAYPLAHSRSLRSIWFFPIVITNFIKLKLNRRLYLQLKTKIHKKKEAEWIFKSLCRLFDTRSAKRLGLVVVRINIEVQSQL